MHGNHGDEDLQLFHLTNNDMGTPGTFVEASEMVLGIKLKDKYHQEEKINKLCVKLFFISNFVLF